MYYTIINNNVISADNISALENFYTDIKFIEGTAADYNDGKFIIQNDELILNPNYKKEKEQKEREELNALSLTAADVERAIYKVKGIDFEDLIENLKENPKEGLDLKALKIELKANHFFRGNPYVNAIGAILGFKQEQLDEFFKTNDYTKLISED